jgi:hypothetical protein
MQELKSLITLSLFLFSASLTTKADPIPNPEPQWETVFGNGNKNGDRSSQQQQPDWGSPYQNNSNPQLQDPKPGSSPAGWGQPAATPRPNPTAAPPPRQTDPDDEAPRWTPPPAWGPRTTPFGPKATSQAETPPAPTASPKPNATGKRPDYCSNTDLICATIVDAPEEPVPYAVMCGKARYNKFDVTNALTAGCYYWKKNQRVGDFPKVFANAEKFDFGDTKGPFYEFPLIDSAAYISGPPGPDRVVFNTPDCFLAGELTNNGIISTSYTECTEEF